MSVGQNEERRKAPPIYASSSIQTLPEAQQERQQPRSCCKALAIIFSALSKTEHLSSPRHEKQVAELREEVQRQRDLKAAYRARLERTQDYLRYCFEVAKEKGFLHLLSDDQELSPKQQQQQPSLLPADEVPSDPLLADVLEQAKLNGWYIEPKEIELHERIGAGTTADIYRGTWRGLGVAVKRIHPAVLLSGESGQAWFSQELHILSRQRHPHVLRLMGACFRSPDEGWLVTELLTGRTLSEWLHGGKERLKTRAAPLPPLAQRVGKALEIAQAMQYLHQQKPMVVHRDLKPSNVLLDDAMRVRVADFGHARFLLDGEKALTGEMGTYVYMAPEIIRGEPYTEKCDVYSFGIILNELITGEHPYIETGFSPCKIALDVSKGKLRPKLIEDDGRCKELMDLLCCSWHEDAASRPSFAMISLALVKILDELK